jgi:hypothetical protein
MTKAGLIRPAAVAAAVLLSLCAGCERAPERRLHLVVLPDLSASIEPRAERDSLDALSRAAAALRRGDSIAVIPIVGDADDDDEGRILRWQYPVEREPFDGDLLRLARQERGELQVLFEEHRTHPYRSTDILGALRVAREELADDSPAAIRAIAILSDFVDDDRRYHFARDRRLRSEKSARQFALSLSRGVNDLAGIRIYLGGLASTDLRGMSRERREAVRVFWTTLLSAEGARIEWASDGPGRLQQFLVYLRKKSVPGDLRAPVLAFFIAPSRK